MAYLGLYETFGCMSMTFQSYEGKYQYFILSKEKISSKKGTQDAGLVEKKYTHAIIKPLSC